MLPLADVSYSRHRPKGAFAFCMTAPLHDLTLLLSVCGSGLGDLFLYAGLGKLSAPREFARSLLLVPHLPHRLARPVGWLIPLLELTAGSLMVVGSRYGKVLILLLLVLFSGVALLAHRRQQAVPCNCFGVGDGENLSPRTVARNAALAVIAAATLVLPKPQQAAFIIMVYGLGACLLFLIINAAMRNRREFVKSFGVLS